MPLLLFQSIVTTYSPEVSTEKELPEAVAVTTELVMAGKVAGYVQLELTLILGLNEKEPLTKPDIFDWAIAALALMSASVIVPSAILALVTAPSAKLVVPTAPAAFDSLLLSASWSCTGPPVGSG